MHVNLGGYHIRDIEFVAAFDIDTEKVGKDLSEAIFTGQNNTDQVRDVPKPGVKVARGMTHDGLGKYLSQVIEKAPGTTADIVAGAARTRRPTCSSPTCRSAPRRPPSGTSSRPSQAGVAFVNCIPVFIAREEYWRGRFEKAGLPIIGDDIKSQVGATILHRVLARLFDDRGVKIERTYQLNVGGNTDFMNMLERERLESKKISKTNAVTSQLDYDLGAGNVHIGPSDHVPWLTRPQVGLHPRRGPLVRRRAADRRAEARGLGLAQLGGHRHRRRPADQAGARPRHRRRARLPVGVPHEVAARPAPRRGGARRGRGVHRDARPQPAPAPAPST